MRLPILMLALVTATPGMVKGAQLGPSAPKDKPVPVIQGEVSSYERAIAPYIERGRATYPAAKQRYLSGLPPRHTFFIVTNLRDGSGRSEIVFIAVQGIRGDQISGTIANDVTLVKGFKHGDHFTCSEADLIDWLISKPDGTEEGNVVGNFLDTYRP